MARFPVAKFDDDLVADVGGAACIARRQDVDVVRNPGIVRDDKKKLFAALEGADDGGVLAFEDANDRARALVLSARYLAADQDAVSVERGAGGAFGNDNFRKGGIVGIEKTFALAVDADDSGHQVGFARLNVAVALGADDLAVFLKTPQRLLQGDLTFAGARPRRRKQLAGNPKACSPSGSTDVEWRRPSQLPSAARCSRPSIRKSR